MAEVFDVGDLVSLKGTFRNPETWVGIDPGAIFCAIKNPAGTEVLYQYGIPGSPVVREALGVYYIHYSIAADGEHYWRFHSTGTGQAAAERSFSVRPSKFTEVI